MSDDIVIKEGYIYGGWRAPVNIWQGAPGSIHTDDVAQKIGMRGGTIPGTIHLNLFPPLLIELFGQRWFEKGSLSIYYTYATLDREEVRAVIELPPEGAENVQLRACVETPEGNTVAKGTVGIGEPEEASYIRKIPLESSPPEELRILAKMEIGKELPPQEDVVFTQEQLDKALEMITDPIDWYKGSSPWGPSILNPSSMYGAMMMDISGDRVGQAVGFFGATELRNVNGPIKAGIPYRKTGRIVCVGTSPKTEFIWADSELYERDSGKLVADMRHMNRLMKASSPLYQEA
ncbi:MAG: hypothetical protein JSV77_09110 [Dehalococcoidales bacterium]|nr:MAG: hypothetical protein JSV77_09110 [Dehalococcoidales bacterium]